MGRELEAALDRGKQKVIHQSLESKKELITRTFRHQSDKR